MATISRLSILLTMNSAQFDRGMDRAAMKVRSFGTFLKGSLSAGVVAASSALTAAIVAAAGFHATLNRLSASAERLDRLSKIIQRFGVDAGAFQRLSIVAADAGVNIEELARAINFMAKNVGSGGKPLDKRFAELARQIMELKDPAERVAKSMEIFGRSGAELIPLFEDIAAGNLERAGAILERFGQTLTSIDLRGVERMNDAFQRLTQLFTGFFDKMVATFAPGITVVLEEIINILMDFGDSTQTVTERWAFLKEVALETGITIAAAMRLGAASLEFIDSQLDLVTSGFERLIATVKQDWPAVEKAMLRQVEAQGRMIHSLGELNEIMTGRFRDNLRKKFIEGFSPQGIIGPWREVASDISLASKFEGAGALERGSTEAVRAVTQSQSQLANPLAAIERHTAAMLSALRQIKENTSDMAVTDLAPVTGGG